MSAKLKIVISMAVFGTLALFVKNISLPPASTKKETLIIAISCTEFHIKKGLTECPKYRGRIM